MDHSPIEIDVHQVKAMLESDEGIFLLDCREHDEFEYAKIEGARLIPMGEIAGRVEELSEFKDQKIVVMCHLGGRSLRVTQWLRNNGFPDAQNMTGGIEAWSVEIDPGVQRY